MESIISMIRSSVPSECLGGAEQAGHNRLRAAVPALIELLLRRGPEFKNGRRAAALALGEIGDVRALNWLGEASYYELLGDGMESLVVSAEVSQRLLSQPGAEEYAARLQKIIMYHLGDFFGTAEVHISPDIQNRRENPFSMESAKRFFLQNFTHESFYFEGEVRAIVIQYGEEQLPAHSFAGGWLYSATLDGIGSSQNRGSTVHPVGRIHLRFGGEVTIPMIEVTPEPNWPRPAIVKRQSPGRVWFEELD